VSDVSDVTRVTTGVTEGGAWRVAGVTTVADTVSDVSNVSGEWRLESGWRDYYYYYCCYCERCERRK
jgi:hypothetical protein